MEENRIPKKSIIYDFGNNEARGRPRNRWKDEVWEDGKGWQEKVRNREEWKKLLRTARNRRILHVPMEQMKYNNVMMFDC